MEMESYMTKKIGSAMLKILEKRKIMQTVYFA